VLDEHLRQEVCWRGARDRRGGGPTHEPVEDERTEAQTDLVGGLKRIGAQPGRARARQGDAVLGCACLLRKWMLMNRGGTPGEQGHHEHEGERQSPHVISDDNAAEPMTNGLSVLLKP
jgi:hypothetical protein